MNTPDGYDLQNKKFIAGCRRLLEAVRNGPPTEDPVRLDLDALAEYPHPQPKVSTQYLAEGP